MTTPYERLNALRMARELLRQIQADGLLSSTLRERAANTLSDYPYDHCLDQLIEKNAVGLPDSVATSLAGCSSLVHGDAVEMRRQGSPETVMRLRLVARHFPDVGEILHLRDLHNNGHLVAHFANGISSWIAQDPAALASRSVGSDGT